MHYKLAFTPTARRDFRYWKEHDEATVRKIKSLLLELREHPFTGTGKPEPLKYQFAGAWSRRINRYDRLIYKVVDDKVVVVVISMRYHYDK